jgi:hypothetical protein
MSIIHDALKKVQQTNNPGTPTPPVFSKEPERTPEPPKSQDKISIPLLIAVICAIIGMTIAALLPFLPKKTLVPPAPVVVAPQPPVAENPAPIPEVVQPAAPSQDTVSKAVASAIATPTTPAPTPPAQKVVNPDDPIGSLQIEGVVDMGGKKAVLINGNVYEEGQTIYGRIISEITFDSLTVIENGQKRTLPITVKP